jgi:hypothetical protein
MVARPPGKRVPARLEPREPGAGSTGVSEARSTIGSMGRVIELAAWREGRERNPVARLERAISRLDSQLERGTGRIGSRVEAELLAITAAMSAGLQEEAAERAERLAERLEHPSASLSG